MALMDAMLCGRRAFLYRSFPSRMSKSGTMQQTMRQILSHIPFRIGKEELDREVENAFQSLEEKRTLTFERESECAYMKDLIWRYLCFEALQTGSTTLRQDFSQEITISGAKHKVSAQRLIDRGEFVECIRYFYRSPDLTYRGKKDTTLPKRNLDLLALQICGEKEAASLGIKKPVHASFYYLKSRNDRSRFLTLGFEMTRGSNIIRWRFSDNEKQELLQWYQSKAADPEARATDEKLCYTCVFRDICQTEFEKRPVKPPIPPEESPLPLKSFHLTETQKKFIQFEEGQCRVNAVAGSGKTTIVTLRTLRLIREGCPASDILMITFTEKARMEMQSRLKRYAKGMNLDADQVVVETFNSFGQNLLNQYYDHLGFTRPPVLVDEVAKRDIAISLLEEHRSLPVDYRNPFLELPHASGAVVQLLHLFEKLKASHVETADEITPLVSDEWKELTEELFDMYHAYNEALIKRNEVDYEDQLRLVLKLKSRGVFQNLPYQHIVIDEFQDSDPNQINLILEMAHADKKLKSLVVVGDEMQAIYSFRNANPENLVHFKDYFPNMVDIPLEDNFRSQSAILTLANRILDKEARIPKVIRTGRTDPGMKPVLRQVEDVDAERSLYARQIRKLIQGGTKPRDIAILCRTKAELLGLRESLEKLGIPVTLRIPEIVGDAPYVKAIIGLATFLLDHTDLSSFALYQKSQGKNVLDGTELQAEAENLASRYGALETEQERMQLFHSLIQDAQEDRIGAAFVKQLTDKRFYTVKQLFYYCTKYRAYAIKEIMTSVCEDTNAVTLITVHSAKGLEWPVVLLSLRKFQPADDEEYRLLYVAVTRAMEKLLITYTDKQNPLASLMMEPAACESEKTVA